MIRLGMHCKAYFGSAGTSPTETPENELSNLKNVTLGLETAEADVTTRANNGWKASVGTLKEGSVEFEMVWDTEDKGFKAIQQAWFDSGAIALKILDGKGGSGLDADFAVISFNREEPLDAAVTAKVTMKPTYSGRPATWIDGTTTPDPTP